jgi:hypothetical protein
LNTLGLEGDSCLDPDGNACISKLTRGRKGEPTRGLNRDPNSLGDVVVVESPASTFARCGALSGSRVCAIWAVKASVWAMELAFSCQTWFIEIVAASRLIWQCGLVEKLQQRQSPKHDELL